MPYDSISDLPKGVTDNLPKHAQEIYLAAFNNAWEEYNHDEDRARRVAWAAVKKGGYAKDEARRGVEKAGQSESRPRLGFSFLLAGYSFLNLDPERIL